MLEEEQAFSLLKRRIFLDRGLDCKQYKENYLKRRFAVRMRATGARDYLEYLRILRNDPNEYTRLLDELTINVTQFFRDEDVYLKLRDEVIPEVLREKEKISSRSIRIWSAGCSSGEEAYSAAILVDYNLKEEMQNWNVRIVASDIDEISLKLAREGTYEAVGILKGMDPKRYFEVVQTDEGRRYRVKEFIRQRVKVERINLIDKHEKRHFDIVLCRNVLIYFSREVQSRLIHSLALGMRKGGFLVLGKSETLGRDVEVLFKPVFPRERIYRLVSEPGS